MKNYLKKIDNFGASFQPLINTESEHKSIIGGLFTLIVYGTSLAYFVFVLIQWQTGQILPKTMSQPQTTDFQIYEIPDDLIKLTYVRYNDNSTDPFREQGNILMPIAVVLENNKPISILSILNKSHSSSDYGTVQIEMDDIEIVKNSKNNKTMDNNRFFSLIVTTCKEKYLTGNQSCASKEEIEKFLDEVLIYLEIDVTLQQLNSQTKELEEVTKQFQFILQTNSTIKIDLLLQSTNTVVDDNPIFQNSKELDYFSDCEVITQTLKSTMTRFVISDEALLQIQLKVNPIQINYQVTFVKLGDLLANVGSISSLLLTVSWFIMQYNKEALENTLIDDIISIYYPQFREIKKVKNCMGKTVELIHDKNKLNKEEFEKWYSMVRQKIISKFSIINQQNEIARMYFIIRQQMNLQSLQKYQHYGIQLPSKLFFKPTDDEINNELPTPFSKELNNMEVESCKIIKSEMELCEDDINALSCYNLT